MKRRSSTSKNSIIQKKRGIFLHLITIKLEICRGEEEEEAPRVSVSVKCAPRDTGTADSVDYPLTAEGVLKKFHAPFKHERNKEAVDNTKNINEKLYTINKKPTTQILNMDINSYKSSSWLSLTVTRTTSSN